MVFAITIACCLVFWWKCSRRYNITRNERFALPFQFKDI